MTTTAARVAERLSQYAGLNLDTITEEKTLDAYGLDSLDRVEFVMELEEEFGTEITDADLDRLAPMPLSAWTSYIDGRIAAGTL